jgi:hypothetical protein
LTVVTTRRACESVAAYDPLGDYAPLPPAPPRGQSTQSYGVYAPNYNWTPSSLSNANDLATVCVLDGRCFKDLK